MKRLLIVDDDPFTRELVTRILQSDYDLTLAESGQDAFELVKKESFDLILLDVVMPEMDGYEVLKWMRSYEKTALTPVIFLTGRTREDDRIRGFRLGADDYLDKPFSHEELRLRVKRMLIRMEEMEQLFEETGLEGTLKDFSLASLLTLLAMENKTGFLHVVNENWYFILHLRNGQLIRARCRGNDEMTSYQIIYEALSWKSGTFRFGKAEVKGEDELQQSTSQLLLDVAREMDEKRHGVWQLKESENLIKDQTNDQG